MNKFVKFSVIFVLVFGVCVYLFFEASPPKEAGLIHRFNENRATFEQLRGMLQADPYLSRREEYSPPEKIEKYHALLKVVGSPSVWVDGRGTNADLFFMVWGWGFAGETEHLCICWLNQIPTNQITTLDGYRGQRRYPNAVVVYKHIEQQWYLSADW